MIWVAWSLGSVVTYLAIGWRVAVWDMPQLFARQKEGHPSWHPTKIRGEVRALSTAIGVFWPLCLPYLVMSREADKRDPVRLAEKLRQQELELAERDRTIAELEAKYLPPRTLDSEL